MCRRSGIAAFHNTTDLDDSRLGCMCLDAVAGWRLDGAVVRIRYSRGADYSGSCYYADARLFVNLGQHLTYPYRMGTHLARTQSNGRRWWKPIYTIELMDAYQLVLMVFLHECYHLLVKRAGRNVRQKESMCDRFAARTLVGRHGAIIRDDQNRFVARSEWDIRDVEAFVASARRPIARSCAQ